MVKKDRICTTIIKLKLLHSKNKNNRKKTILVTHTSYEQGNYINPPI